MRGGRNKLREQITRVLETDKKKMAQTWRERLKIILAESESIIETVLQNIITAVQDEEKWPGKLGGLPSCNRPFKGLTHT